jgi:pimeloyl-ACP methyl ester carboxylesterase
LDALDEETAVFVGHDWGAPVVWNLALRAPERVRGVVGMSVPFTGRGAIDPLTALEAIFGDRFFYMVYFQAPGVADADLGSDPEDSIRRFMTAIEGDAASGLVTDLPKDGTRLRDWLPEPKALPAWLTEDDVSYYVSEFTRTGFTGGLNWYRNLRRNWEITDDLANRKVEVPATFIAGDRDPVIAMIQPEGMAEWVTDLRATLLIPGAGHWIQQERPGEVNAALLDFLAGLTSSVPANP